MAARRVPRLTSDRELELKLEGRGPFLDQAFSTYQAVAAALRRGAPDALAAKTAVAAQWIARNHSEVGPLLDTALRKAAGADGQLARRIRLLPDLRAEVAARLEQQLSTTVERAGGLSPLLLAASRRALLAWSSHERDWHLADGAVFRIPAGFTVAETQKGAVTVRWSSALFAGRLDLRDRILIIPSWLFADRKIKLSSLRTNEQEDRARKRSFSLHGTDIAAVERELFTAASLYDADFLCQVICHFTGARRDSHRFRQYGE